MTTYLRSPEAARRLGVTLNTLYAYVSRGRVHRTLAADGRTSLFDLEEIDALRERSQRGPSEPPPSIDVRIATGVTRLDETGPSYRNHRIETLLDRSFEEAAELLWTGELPTRRPRWEAPAGIEVRDVEPSDAELIRLALDLDDAQPGLALDAPDVARRLLAAIPLRFGVVPGPTDPLAASVARLWVSEPSDALVAATDRALLLLADHELATSTLAVRVATSVRASTTMSFVAGLAAVAGDLHGAASSYAHRLLDDAARVGAREAIARARSNEAATTAPPGADVAGRVPGFGHSIYRLHDPRFAPLMERVRQLPDPDRKMQVVDELLVEAGASVPKAPNVDLALGALTWLGGLPEDAPLFSIARIAGWTAHHLEERDERPLRFRGLAR